MRKQLEKFFLPTQFNALNVRIYLRIRFLKIQKGDIVMRKYLIATATALIIALAVTVTRAAPAIGGEWLLLLMAPGGVWVWEDIVGD